MNLVFVYLLSVAAIPSSPSTSILVTDWTVKLNRPQGAAEQARQFFVGALSPLDDSFIVSGIRSQVEKRSLRTGEILWARELDHSSPSSWATDGQAIYGADGNGQVLKISLTTGEDLWKFPSKGLYFVRPLIFDGRVYVQNSYGNLEVYRADNGSWLWQQSDPLDVSLGLISHESAQVFGNLIVSGFPSGVLNAFEPLTGKRIWSSSFASASADASNVNDLRSLRASGDYLVASSFSSDLRLWKRMGDSQKLLWEKKMSIPQPASFETDHSRIYVCDRQGVVSAIETETGFLQWQYQLPSGLGSSVAVGDSSLWIATTGGHVVVLDKQGVEIARSNNLETLFVSEPLLLNDGGVVVTSARGIIRKMRLL